MTEEEAKTKWCPMASSRAIKIPCRDESTDVARWNNDKGGLSVLCIASDCMMWVQDSSFWAKDGRRIATESDEFNNYLTPEDGGFETVCEGRCGLVK